MGKVIGFVGCGNMARSMIGGILRSNLFGCDDILVSAKSDETLGRVRDLFGVQTFRDNRDVASRCDVLFLTVKPHLYERVIGEICSSVREGTVVVSVAPGKSISSIKAFFGRDVKLVRTMPNTPALVGEGMTAFCPCDLCSMEDVAFLRDILLSFGCCEEIEEALFDAVVSVSGSSPAYVFMFIEAMADAAVLQGMPRDKAYRFASQAVLGSARMVLESNRHPGELKDMVCSPSGTTIESVAVLEECGFRSSVIKAMIACGKKSSIM